MTDLSSHNTTANTTTKKHNIVMVENIALARALAKEVEIGKAIPTKWYQAVAEVLSIVYKLKKKAA